MHFMGSPTSNQYQHFNIQFQCQHQVPSFTPQYIFMGPRSSIFYFQALEKALSIILKPCRWPFKNLRRSENVNLTLNLVFMLFLECLGSVAFGACLELASISLLSDFRKPNSIHPQLEWIGNNQLNKEWNNWCRYPFSWSGCCCCLGLFYFV